MTLLSVAQDVCDVIGLTRPAAIITGPDALSRQILGLAKETLAELGRMDWPMLEIPYSFNTAVGVAQYSLPADFGREVGDTLYVASQYSQLRGSLTPADWQRQRNSFASQTGKYRYRIFGLPLAINFSGTPQVVEQVIMEYQTTYRVRQADATYKNTFYADTDVSLIDEELLKKGLKWRLMRRKGLDYSEEFNDYEIQRAQFLAQGLGMGSIPVATRSSDEMELGYYIPENGYGH